MKSNKTLTELCNKLIDQSPYTDIELFDMFVILFDTFEDDTENNYNIIELVKTYAEEHDWKIRIVKWYDALTYLTKNELIELYRELNKYFMLLSIIYNKQLLRNNREKLDVIVDNIINADMEYLDYKHLIKLFE